MKNLINFVLFQVGWFVTVISVSNQMEYIAIFSVLGVLAAHLYLIAEKLKEFILILAAGLLGFVVDSILISGDLFSASGDLGLKDMAPLWLVLLWMLFSITINHSLGWLRYKYLLAALMGAVFAPLAYYVGTNFEVLTFSNNYSSMGVMLIIGFTWAVVTPLMIYVSRSIFHHQLKMLDSF